MFFERIFELVSPAGRKARLSTLIFHRVFSAKDELFPDEPDIARFDEIMGWVKDWFRVLPLDEAVARLRAGALPPRPAAITFDDGYADNFDNVVPILRKHSLPAAFFVTTGFLDGERPWNDTVIEAIRRCQAEALDLGALGLGVLPLDSMAARRRAIEAILPAIKYLSPGDRTDRAERIAELAGANLPADLMMTSEQVRQLHRSGLQIGAHTVNHPILARVDLAEARREIVESRRFLEDLLETRVGLFAYPNGKPGADFLPEHADLVKELGFDAAFSTAPDCATSRSDPFQLPRFTPWDRTKGRFALRLLRNMLV